MDKRQRRNIHFQWFGLPGKYLFFLGIGMIMSLYAFAQAPISSCKVKDAGKRFRWNYLPGEKVEGSTIKMPVPQPETDDGYIFDIDSLDNSFNMVINGVKLAQQEIEFQEASPSGTNIRFADGDEYGKDVEQIYHLTGDDEHPIIRIRISAGGDVSMYGAKKDGGPLFPLVLFRGNNFNKVTWHASQKNQVVVTQLIQGRTTMKGYGYGIKTVQCSFFMVVPDINQTPINEKVQGNVLTNDEGVGITIKSATYSNQNEQEKNLPLNTATAIYSEQGNLSGQLTLQSTGGYLFIPESGFTGDWSIVYQAEDQNGFIEKTDLAIKVIPAVYPNKNNPPIAQNDVAFTEANTAVSSTLFNNDSDPDKDPLTVSHIEQGNTPLTIGSEEQVSGIDQVGVPVSNAGSLTVHSNGTYHFQPATDFLGTINSLTYILKDSKGGMDKAVLNITVLEDIGNQIFAHDDANAAPKGDVLAGNMLQNDNDPEGNQLQFTSVSIEGKKYSLTSGNNEITLSGIGRLDLNRAGTYHFYPQKDFVGTLPITYMIQDDGKPQDSSKATLYLTALKLLIIPTAVDDEKINQIPGTEITISAIENDTPKEIIAPATISFIGPPGSTTEDSNHDGRTDKVIVPNEGRWAANASGEVSFHPNLSFRGNPTPIGYTVENVAGMKSNEAAITIQYNQTPPEAVEDSIHSDTLGIPVNMAVTANDIDQNGSGIDLGTVSLDGPSGSIATDTNNDGRIDKLKVPGEGVWIAHSNGDVVFTPTKGTHGNPTPIRYTIQDSAGFESNLSIIKITFSAIPPIARDDSKNKQQSGAKVWLDVTHNDEPGNGGLIQPSTIALSGSASSIGKDTNGDGRIDQLNVPDQGVWEVSTDDLVSFTPNSGFYGAPDAIKYTVLDESGQETNPATITITISNDVFFPNMFSPNQDGRNDVWKAYSHTMENISIQIFNQYGQKVFASNKIDAGWDGRYKGKAQPIGVYVYFAKIKFNDGATSTRKGTITLIR